MRIVVFHVLADIGFKKVILKDERFNSLALVASCFPSTGS
jgi:hypothetical protein